ncbi:MAG TPA: hypothetical protein VF250_15005 [Conexibacter sp.]
MSDRIADAMARLCAAERDRREAIDDLIALGVVRWRRLVADIGEALAARYYGVPLAANANEPGYDLVARDGLRIQVRTLRSEPHRERTVMGVMKEPYDALFAVKLSVDYEPLPSKGEWWFLQPRAERDAGAPQGGRLARRARGWARRRARATRTDLPIGACHALPISS